MSDSTPPATTAPAPTRTIEQIIDDLPRIGLSRLAWAALAVGYFFGIYEGAMLALALPSIEHGLGVDTLALSIPIAVNAIGFAIGAYVLGIIADRRGRQTGMRITFTVFAIGALGCALAWDIASLSVARFIIGCGMGAVVALITIYLGEVSPRTQRGRQVALFTLLGTILVSISSVIALPLLRAVPDDAWRYILGLPVVAIVIVALINERQIVESPRWLVEHGRLDEAVVIVRDMDRRARRGDSDLDSVEIVEAPRTAQKTGAKPMAILFSTPRLATRLTIISVAVLVFYTAFFSLSTYLTTFLINTGVAEDRALEIVAVSRVATVFAAIAIVFLIERVERRLIIAGSIVVIIVGITLIMFGLGDALTMTGTILASLATGILVPALYTFIAEIFPTEVRATGTATADGIGRLGGVIAPFAFVPILIGAGAIAGGTFLIVLMVVALLLILIGLPFKTKGRALDDASA